MLVKTDKALFDALSGALLYDTDPDIDYTVDTAPRVCRFNSSEYQSLMDDGTIPFVSIEYTDDDYDANERPPIADGDRVYQYTDINKTDVRMNRHPIPVIVNYTIHVKSPKDLWQREIETEIARLLMPL
ncbi:hypothetical protein KAU11_10160, partial [Candidatus Babeliales bacterium]|nr:hypothetical protein [Candidatus Babeliales bacterium]